MKSQKNNWRIKLGYKLSVLGELFAFLWRNKLWWMVPLVAVFVLLGLVIWLVQSSAVVPFVYTLF